MARNLNRLKRPLALAALVISVAIAACQLDFSGPSKKAAQRPSTNAENHAQQAPPTLIPKAASKDELVDEGVIPVGVVGLGIDVYDEHSHAVVYRFDADGNVDKIDHLLDGQRISSVQLEWTAISGGYANIAVRETIYDDQQTPAFTRYDTFGPDDGQGWGRFYREAQEIPLAHRISRLLAGSGGGALLAPRALLMQSSSSPCTDGGLVALAHQELRVVDRYHAIKGGSYVPGITDEEPPDEKPQAMACLKSIGKQTLDAVRDQLVRDYAAGRITYALLRESVADAAGRIWRRWGGGGDSIEMYQAGSCITVFGRSACKSILEKMQN